MRVTDTARYQSATQALSSARARLIELERQASSGLRVNTPSDDPVAAARARRVVSALEDTAGRREAIESGRSRLELCEGVLGEAGELLVRAREIAMSMSNASAGAADRAAAAQQVAGIRDALREIANTRDGDEFVFAGNRSDTAPFDATGAFVGDSAERSIELGNGQRAQISASGARAFTAAGGGEDVFAVLDTLRTALESNDADAVRATLDPVTRSYEQMLGERTMAGLRIERLTVAGSFAERMSAVYEEQKSSLVSADYVGVLAQLGRARTDLEGAVAVTEKILSERGLLG